MCVLYDASTSPRSSSSGLREGGRSVYRMVSYACDQQYVSILQQRERGGGECERGANLHNNGGFG